MNSRPKTRLRGLEKRDNRKNLIARRLHAVRHLQSPPWTMQKLSDEVAEQLDFDISVTTIARIETGVRGAADWEVAAFAYVLRVSADWLLGLVDDGALTSPPTGLLPSREQ